MQAVSDCYSSSHFVGKRELQAGTAQAFLRVQRVLGNVYPTAGKTRYLAHLLQEDAELPFDAQIVGALRFGPHAVWRPQPDSQPGLDAEEIVPFHPHDHFGSSVGLEVRTEAGDGVMEAGRGVEGRAQGGPRDLDVRGARWFGLPLQVRARVALSLQKIP
jgi:hypothetical protein